MEDQIEINWQCQAAEECNHIQPEMELAQHSVHVAMKYPRKEKVGKRECEEQPRTCKDSFANVALGEMDLDPVCLAAKINQK